MNYQDIISLFKTNVNSGVGGLFEQYGQKLYGFTVKRWNLNEDESYDVLYKTLETVGKVITRYEFVSENHFRNWLFKIHKNNILQFIRAKKNKEGGLIFFSFNDWEEEAKEIEDNEFDIEPFKSVIKKYSYNNAYDDSASSNKLMNAMQIALQQIDETERDILLLRMNNYSYEEIARMLGIENNQLKVKFSRAKTKLQKITLSLLNEYEIK